MPTETQKNGFKRKSGAKLTYREVINIREAYDEYGIPVKALAKTYGVHWYTIYNIVKRKTWQDV